MVKKTCCADLPPCYSPSMEHLRHRNACIVVVVVVVVVLKEAAVTFPGFLLEKKIITLFFFVCVYLHCKMHSVVVCLSSVSGVV